MSEMLIPAPGGHRVPCVAPGSASVSSVHATHSLLTPLHLKGLEVPHEPHCDCEVGGASRYFTLRPKPRVLGPWSCGVMRLTPDSALHPLPTPPPPAAQPAGLAGCLMPEGFYYGNGAGLAVKNLNRLGKGCGALLELNNPEL